MDLTEYERELLSAVEAGEMPLAVYADWLEGEGDPRAAGARWLAENGKRPQELGIGWWWPSLENSPRGLAPSIRAHMSRQAEPYDSFAKAIASGTTGTSLRLRNGPIDENGEFAELVGQRKRLGEAYSRWLTSSSLPLAKGVAWLVERGLHPGAKLFQGPGVPAVDVWKWLLAEEHRTSRDQLPTEVFRHLERGENSDEDLRRLGTDHRVYDDFETAFVDAARAVEQMLAELPRA